jgi:hypothetical protein
MTKMFAYQKKLKDEESWANKGQVFGGVAIGIILFGKAGYALPPGSIENATTFITWRPASSAWQRRWWPKNRKLVPCSLNPPLSQPMHEPSKRRFNFPFTILQH